MRLFDHESFYKYFRMTPSRFDHLLSLIGPCITKESTTFRNSVSPGERLAITLRYLATGDSMQTIAFSYRVGHSTVCNIIKHTCTAIWNTLRPLYIRTPTTYSDWKEISREFNQYWNFPHCIGSIDGKHVVIQAPNGAGSLYYNYKHTHSIVLLAVCDAKYCFTLLNIGDYGSHSDGGVLRNSSFGRALESNQLSIPQPEHIQDCPQPLPYVFLGDAAFPLRENILRPYPGKYLPEPKKIFNYRLSRARRVVENAFGIMASRFRIFRRTIIASPEKASLITQATCTLHNYLIISDRQLSHQDHLYCPPNSIDHEDERGNFVAGDWRADESSNLADGIRLGGNRPSVSALTNRDHFSTYFSSATGRVAWQDAQVRLS
ncbi:uncharacterized protein [Oscarella lobularis]|uniref:uncharacterized protein n=1 Tax=Oscarella lobularis TaxID=121494 RepID=UPI0033143FA6